MDKREVTANDKGCRLDVYLTESYPELSRSGIKNLITKGLVLVNKEAKKAGYALKIGDIIEITIPEPVEIDLVPQDIPLEIVYQDNDLAVINKPQGLTVHPSAGHKDGTLVNALLYHFKDLSGINGELRPGIVHRLDKDTSGLMLVAKNDFAHRDLAKQIAEKTCIRKYIALLEGHLKPEHNIIETHIARSQTDRKKMSVSTDANDRIAITEYQVIEYLDNYTLANFILKTGRTHQIRVHASYLKHPVVGDEVYGYKKQKFATKGQLLHSQYIEFTHPRTKERLHFSVPLPDYFAEIVEKLRKKTKSYE